MGVQEDMDVVARMRTQGWMQGSVIEEAELRVLLADEYEKLNEPTVAIVISQDCDIVCRNLESEPDVELLLGRLAEDGFDGSCAHGKRPRRLHMRLRDQARHLDLEIRSKTLISKKLLVDLEPSTINLSDKQRDELVHWLARRYTRLGLPDEFNARWKTGKTRRKLEGAAKKGAEPLVSG